MVVFGGIEVASRRNVGRDRLRQLIPNLGLGCRREFCLLGGVRKDSGTVLITPITKLAAAI